MSPNDCQDDNVARCEAEVCVDVIPMPRIKFTELKKDKVEFPVDLNFKVKGACKIIEASVHKCSRPNEVDCRLRVLYDYDVEARASHGNCNPCDARYLLEVEADNKVECHVEQPSCGRPSPSKKEKRRHHRK